MASSTTPLNPSSWLKEHAVLPRVLLLTPLVTPPERKESSSGTRQSPRYPKVNLADLCSITNTPYNPEASEDAQPWIEPPFRCDYGYNISLGPNSFVNFGCTILDTCKVTIGARTLVGPNVSFYAATHPLEAEVRRGTEGPEAGKEITVGEDCWIGGMATILPGVKLGRGVVVAAAAVVTKDVEDFCVVAGNPARVIKRLKGSEEGREDTTSTKALLKRLEVLEAEMKEVKEKLVERAM